MDAPEATNGLPGSLTVRLATNTIVQVAGSLLAALVGFFTFVAVTRGLGPEAFGDFTAAMVFLFIPVAVADVGLSAAVLREISRAPERTEPAMRASVPLRALVSAAVTALAAGIGLAMPFNDRTTTAVLIGSVGSFLTLMSLALSPVLQAQLKMHWSVAGNLAGRVATLALTLGALALGGGFTSIVWAWVIGLGVTFSVHIVGVRRLVALAPVVDRAYWRSLVAGSLMIGLAIAISQIYFRIDALLLALIRSSEEVGLYGAAYKFVEIAQFLGGAVAVSMFPPLARFVKTGDPRARELTQKTFDVLLAGGVLLTLLMLAFPAEIVVATAGTEFREADVAVQLLAPSVLFGFVNGMLFRVLLATERDRALLAFAAGVLGANVVLNLALIPEYGLEAAAVVYVACEALVLVPLAFAARRDGLLPDLRYAPHVGAATAAAAAAAWLVPGRAALAAVVAGALYTTVLVSIPGTVREVVRSVLPRRPRLLRARP
jgi:O-antigen/teichoic acid export membrane protein